MATELLKGDNSKMRCAISGTTHGVSGYSMEKRSVKPFYIWLIKVLMSPVYFSLLNVATGKIKLQCGSHCIPIGQCLYRGN